MSLGSKLLGKSVLLLIAFLVLGRIASAEPALWMVRDADSILYLFGTVHRLPADLEWRDKRIDAALAASDELWSESSPMSPGLLLPIVRHAINFGPSVMRQLTPDEAASLRWAMSHAGFSGIVTDRMKPWLIALLIRDVADKKSETGADEVLRTMAKAGRKRIRYLEDASGYFKFFSGLSPEIQMEFLRYRIAGVDDGKTEDSDPQSDLRLMAWSKGEVENLLTLGDEDPFFSPGKPFHDWALRQRNELWMKKIKRVLARSGTSFIAVGAAHFAGPDSLLVMLEAEGYRAERIYSEGADPR